MCLTWKICVHLHFSSWGRGGGGGEEGVLKYKMGMYVLSYVKKKGGGGYRADQIEQEGTFRAERTVKVVSEKVGAFRANRTEKVGAFRANKTKKRVVFTAAHTRTALI